MMMIKRDRYRDTPRYCQGLSYADRGSCGIKEPLPTTPFMVGSGGGWIVKRLVVVDRL
jgi:hypothetical protein